MYLARWRDLVKDGAEISLSILDYFVVFFMFYI